MRWWRYNIVQVGGGEQPKRIALSNDHNHHFLKKKNTKQKRARENTRTHARTQHTHTHTHTHFGIDHLYRRYNDTHIHTYMYIFGHHGEMLVGGGVVPVLNGIEFN